MPVEPPWSSEAKGLLRPTKPRPESRSSTSATSQSQSHSHRGRSASPPRGRDRDLDPSAAPASAPAPSRNLGKHTVPACERCRVFKKKCSRTFPVCKLCANAGQECSFSAPPATPEGENLQLRARLQWLTEYVNGHLADAGESVENFETGSDLGELLGRRRHMAHALRPAPVSTPPNLASNAQAPYGPPAGPSALGVPLDRSTVSPTDPSSASLSGYQHSVSGTEGGLQEPSTDASARRFVHAYFRNVNRAYPFMNQNKILENLETLGDLARGLHNSQSTLLYLVMSIGCTTLERAGQIPKNTAKRFEVAYAEIIQECVSHESVESVQILMLLALYSLFDPVGPPAYSVVGIAARQAITIGLTCLTEEQGYAPAEMELRHRLYWSIFALDRMMAVSQGLPVALLDNMDVPFPNLTVEEFASTERIASARKLQTSRHVIQLRRLEGQILEQVHYRRRAEVEAVEPSVLRATLGTLRASVEEWYSQCCRMSYLDSENRAIHSEPTWLSARYYYLLLLLYYPNHYNSLARAVSRRDLTQFAQHQLQTSSTLYQQQQLPLNSNTLYRLMPVCLVIMYDFVATSRMSDWNAQTAPPFQAREEVKMAQGILEAFPENWQLAHRTAQVIRQFSGVISGGIAMFYSDTPLFPLGAGGRGGAPAKDASDGGGEGLPVLMKPCIDRLTSLMQEMLGQSTCFQFVVYPEDDKRTDGPVGPSRPSQQFQPQMDVQHSLVPMNWHEMEGLQGVVDPSGMMQYGWGTIDLDFL